MGTMIERADLTTRPAHVFSDRDESMAFSRRTGATRAGRDPKTGAWRAAPPWSLPSSSPRIDQSVVKALLERQAEARHCVRLYRLARAIASTPPDVLRRARLREAMFSYLEDTR